MLRFFLISLLCFYLAACGGGSSGSTTLRVNFSGEWLVAFNIIVDECGLVDADTFSFEDDHFVSQTDGAIELRASQLLLENYQGSIRSDSSFLVAGSLEGDIFGDGSSCSLSEEISYSANSDSEATAIYTLKLNCSDGFACSSSARGSATRLVL